MNRGLVCRIHYSTFGPRMLGAHSSMGPVVLVRLQPCTD
jgi:hypothetical protein